MKIALFPSRAFSPVFSVEVKVFGSNVTSLQRVQPRLGRFLASEDGDCVLC